VVIKHNIIRVLR